MSSVAEAEVEQTTPTETQAPEGTALDAIISDSADSALNGPDNESIESTLDVPAESPPEPEADAPVESDWDESLISLAEKYNFTPERAKEYGSPDMLRRAMLDIDRSAALWGKQYLEGQQAEPQQTAQQAQQAPAQQTQQQQVQAERQLRAAIEKYKVELDEDYDPDAKKHFNGMNDHYHKVISDIQSQNEQYITALAERQYMLESAIQQYTGHQQAEGEAQLVRDVDTFVTSLGDEYADVYGKTPTTRLAQTSPLLAERRKLVTEMQHLKAAYGDRFTDAELLEKANAILHSDKQQTLVRKKIQREVKAQQQTQIHRATGHQPKAKSGYERAVAKVAAMMPGVTGVDEESLDSFSGF